MKQTEIKEITFKDYVQAFIEEKSITLSPVTVKNYERELRKVGLCFDDKKMKNIGFSDLKRYFNDMQLSMINQYTHKALKHSTIVQHYIILHAFFESAVESEIIEINPMEKLRRPRKRKTDIEESVRIFYDEEKIKYVLTCLKTEPLKWQAIIRFAIDSGCRCGEIMGLKWEDIEFDTGMVNICRNVQYTSERGTYLCTTKNNKKRTLFLNKPAIKILKEWYAEIDNKNLKSEFCFVGKNGKLMMPGSFNQYLRRFGKKYGLEKIHPHMFRHAMASISIANGADIVSVSKKLGHSKVSLTLDIYSHTSERAQIKTNSIFAKAVYGE